MIKEFIDSDYEVTLITRPRRWGKTLNLSMLHYFFSPKINGFSTAELFNNLEISQIENGRYIKEHQGQYPTLFISLKDVKERKFDDAIKNIAGLIQGVYLPFYEELMNSPHLSEPEKELVKYYSGIINAPEKVHLVQALRRLSSLLYKHHKKQVIILIDEYDTPLNAAYDEGYLDDMTSFMRNFFSYTLKGNSALKKGLMTGILRVSQTSLLSGLNNPAIETILTKGYSRYFGFTESEITFLIKQKEMQANLDDIQKWYNGYTIGGIIIYNPWSIVSYLTQNILAAHWVLTGNHEILQELLINAKTDTQEKLFSLLQGQSIEGKVSNCIIYENIKKNNETALWTLLLFSGYLQAVEIQADGIDFKCKLRIPNYEVSKLYIGIFKEWLEAEKLTHGKTLNLLINENIQKLTDDLGNYLPQEESSEEQLIIKKKGPNSSKKRRISDSNEINANLDEEMSQKKSKSSILNDSPHDFFHSIFKTQNNNNNQNNRNIQEENIALQQMLLEEIQRQNTSDSDISKKRC